MSRPTWHRSHWALVTVVVLVLGLVVVKHTSTRRAAPKAPPSTPDAVVEAIAAAGQQGRLGQAMAAPPAGRASTETAKKTGEPLVGSKLEESLKSGRPTTADFGAGWCDPCKKMTPVLAEAVGKYDGKVNIVYVNTDDYPSVAKGYRISAIPTQVFFDARGEEVGRHVGYYPIGDLDAQLKSLGLVK